jgi:hypothetical protein
MDDVSLTKTSIADIPEGQLVSQILGRVARVNILVTNNL